MKVECQNTVLTSSLISQIVTGITVMQANTDEFKTAFITPTATALGIAVSAVSVTSIVEVIARRTLDDAETPSLRQLSPSSSVSVKYTVTTFTSLCETTTSLVNSATAVSASITLAGLAVSVGAAVVDESNATLPPTPPPTASPSHQEKENPFLCFSGSETVTMRSGDIKTIADVRVGDFVLAASASGKTSFSEVDIKSKHD